MNKKILVTLNNVSKEYNVGKKFSEKNKVINNINLTISKGDRIGLIGKNGAGKTTLFKLITGVATANKGTIRRYGKIVSLMDLEDGFDLELSGRENIMLNGLMTGMCIKEIKQKMSKIINFSGINNYIDNPFFTYSSGMKFRLAFAVAIASECDVLIIDEIFMVGDFDFQSKVLKEIKSLGDDKSNVSLIISSHIPAFLLGLVSECYEIKNGKLKKIKMESLEEAVKKGDQNYKNLLMINDLLKE